MEDKKEKELIKKSEDYAKEQGFKLNSDDKIVKLAIKGLLKNKKEKLRKKTKVFDNLLQFVDRLP